MNDLDLGGKTALITGSVGGIGLAVARALAARGCTVMLNGLDDPDQARPALAGMTRSIAAEVMGQGITCNAVCPGPVLTPSIESRLVRLMAERGIGREAATHEFLAGKQPVARFVPADHVAELVAFLCSDAAAEINGANLPVDHGWLAT